MATKGWKDVTAADAARMGRKATTLASKPRSKYGAVRTAVNGIVFDSKREAARYGQLKLLEKADKIHILEVQPEFGLIVPMPNGGDTPLFAQIGSYRGDFQYCECAGGRNNCGWTAVVVEDVKGFKTALYRWKKRHVEAQYGIQIREIK